MDSQINIYPNIPKSLLLALGCSAFVLTGCVLLINADSYRMMFGGICGLAFIIGVGVGIYFCDVEIFTEAKVGGVKIIQVHFLDNA